jgi:hypothetical protein
MLLMLVGILAFSCTEQNCTTVCDEDEECGGLRATPDSLLNFLAEAYEGRTIAAYGGALHEYFEFEFTPDIADSLGLPPDSPWWDKERDMTSTGIMFDDVHVSHIEFHLSEFGIGFDWDECWREFITGDPPDTTLIQGVRKVFEPEIKVYIDEPGQEERILWVHESLLDIMVTPDPNSEGEWVIVRIMEIKKNPLMFATQPSTWGLIKYLFK